MPYVNIYLIEGRTVEQKREMADKITDVVSEVGKVPRESVHILFIDLPKTNISKGGVLTSDKK
ncbi:tautomerase family protein [bacterium]|nr:tautomerase family protein [bacterium]